MEGQGPSATSGYLFHQPHRTSVNTAEPRCALAGLEGGGREGVMGKQEATDSREQALTFFLIVERTSVLRDEAGARLDWGTTRGMRNKVLNEQHCPFFF